MGTSESRATPFIVQVNLFSHVRISSLHLRGTPQGDGRRQPGVASGDSCFTCFAPTMFLTNERGMPPSNSEKFPALFWTNRSYQESRFVTRTFRKRTRWHLPSRILPGIGSHFIFTHSQFALTIAITHLFVPSSNRSQPPPEEAPRRPATTAQPCASTRSSSWVRAASASRR